MKLKTNIKISTKHTLSPTLRSWLPILEADLERLKETLDKVAKENPFIEIKSGNEISSIAKKVEGFDGYQKRAISTEIESLNFSQKSLYDVLYEQVETTTFFPTKKSQKIAYEIIANINSNGYFDGDLEKIAQKTSSSVEEVEKIRLRFAYLSPSGVGAFDVFESFLFQLNDFDLTNEEYKLCQKLINDFENLQKYKDEKGFLKAIHTLKKMKNPPAIEYKKEELQIIPDIFITNRAGKIEVSLNSAYYPQIIVDTGDIGSNFDFVKDKLKDAKLLIEALNLRKETLTKVALMLIEYQYDFFMGGEIKPLKLEDLSQELGRHHSTISRAIANKYLSCDRGIFPIKTFFPSAVDKDRETSNSAIKNYIKEIIKNEDKKKPLSDSKILQLVNQKFNTKIGRRTITKYRIAMNIGSSTDRKKVYQFSQI